MIDERVEYLEYLYALDEDENNFGDMPPDKMDVMCVGKQRPVLTLKRSLEIIPFDYSTLMNSKSFIISYQRELYFYLDDRAVMVGEVLFLSEDMEKIYQKLSRSGRCFDIISDRSEHNQGEFTFKGQCDLMKKIKKILEVV